MYIHLINILIKKKVLTSLESSLLKVHSPNNFSIIRLLLGKYAGFELVKQNRLAKICWRSAEKGQMQAKNVLGLEIIL